MTDLARILPGSLCDDAIVWLATQLDAATAWATCERGDWLLWQLAHSKHVTRQRLVRAACACSRLALRYVPDGVAMPRIAIETAEAWSDGTATLDQVREARRAAATTADAHAAYAYAAATAASYAATTAAATYAFASAAVATYAAVAATAYAYATTTTAAHAAAAAARTATETRCADIVREHFTLADLIGEEAARG